MARSRLSERQRPTERAGVAPRELTVGRGRRTVRLTRLDQRWWPDEGISKRDVVDYYRAAAPALLPHLRDRPFTFKRHYNGPRSPFEWVKDAPPELPEWIPVAPLPARSRGGELVRYALVNDELALLWAVEFGAVDLHVWTSRADRPDTPDYVLFDLDPAGVEFRDVVDVALLLRDALGALELESLVSTTGGDGLHVRVPIARRHSHAEARAFSEIVAGALVRSSRGLVTTERSRARRRGVFVDTKMNGHGQQIVSVYSVRPGPGALVAAPLRWEEAGADLDPRTFTMERVLERVEHDGDLHARALGGGQRLDRALRQLV
jgi:bifunctional non-homologous end joining protein LigD